MSPGMATLNGAGREHCHCPRKCRGTLPVWRLLPVTCRSRQTPWEAPED